MELQAMELQAMELQAMDLWAGKTEKIAGPVICKLEQVQVVGVTVRPRRAP